MQLNVSRYLSKWENEIKNGTKKSEFLLSVIDQQES